MSKLPELNKSLNTKDFHVDATPDGKYAIRILKCYLERARRKFKVEEMEDNEIKLFDFINKCQDKRVIELERAINMLEGKE
jgi:hypothetical protein